MVVPEIALFRLISFSGSEKQNPIFKGLRQLGTEPKLLSQDGTEIAFPERGFRFGPIHHA